MLSVISPPTSVTEASVTLNGRFGFLVKGGGNLVRQFYLRMDCAESQPRGGMLTEATRYLEMRARRGRVAA